MMNTKIFKAAIVGSVLAATSFGATAAHAATATATARATILRQVTVTNTSDLQFGTIVSGASAANVGVDTAGARTCGAGLVCTGTTTAAGFNVTGTTGQVVTVSVPASVSLTSGSNNMTATLSSSNSTLTMAGSFTVGGSLGVAASQADGAYAGVFTVTVDYQ
jgi:Mat/Ecp fimbriae major subunit